MALKGITINTPPEAAAHILAEYDAAIYQGIYGEDAVIKVGSCFSASVQSNNKIRISDGLLSVGGHMAIQPYGEYTDVSIENGQSGVFRKDIIVAKIESTGSGGVDTIKFEVKKGESGGELPSLVQNSMYQSGKVREFPLYTVRLSGVNIVEIIKMFEPIENVAEIKAEVKELTENIKNGTFDFWKIITGKNTKVSDCLTETIESGFYSWYNGRNQPGEKINGLILAIKYNDDHTFRLAFAHDGTMYFSKYSRGSSWGTWKEFSFK